MFEVNSSLIGLKCVLFLFFGGKLLVQLFAFFLHSIHLFSVPALGSLFPFLPDHMTKLGLSKDEFTTISIVSPLVAVLGPLIVGPVADRLAGGFGGASRSKSGKYLRVMISICLVFATIFYWLLITIPPIVNIYLILTSLFASKPSNLFPVVVQFLLQFKPVKFI